MNYNLLQLEATCVNWVQICDYWKSIGWPLIAMCDDSRSLRGQCINFVTFRGPLWLLLPICDKWRSVWVNWWQIVSLLVTEIFTVWHLVLIKRQLEVTVWQFETITGAFGVNEWQFVTPIGHLVCHWAIVCDNRRLFGRSLKYTLLRLEATWVSLSDNLWHLEVIWGQYRTICDESRSF